MASDNRHASDLLAAEYTLGTLDATARERAVQRSRDDKGFEEAVDRWAERLYTLNATLQPVTPDDKVWAGIERALDRETEVRAVTLSPWRQSWAGRLVWGGGVWGGGALAAALALFLLVARDTLQPTPQPVAQLLAESGGYGWQIAVDEENQHLAIRRAGALPGSSQHSLELWLVGEDGSVRSLGVMSEAPVSTLALAPGLLERLLPGQTLAVSREPLGGSPSGQPTGPVLVAAKLQLP